MEDPFNNVADVSVSRNNSNVVQQQLVRNRLFFDQGLQRAKSSGAKTKPVKQVQETPINNLDYRPHHYPENASQIRIVGE